MDVKLFLRWRVAAAFAVAAFFIGAPEGLVRSATAQTATPEQEVERADSRQGAVRDTLRSSQIAIDTLSDPDCPEVVSYADVLTAPDDVRLNVCYALTQIDDGNVTGAAATLERILLLAPQAANVRYLYAVVLFRLDNIDESEREFTELAEQELPPEVRDRIDGYLDEIDRRRQTTRHSGQVSVGLYYDTNRNSAPQSEATLVAGTRAPIQAARNRRNGDMGLLTILGYDLTHDPQLQDPHELFLGVDMYADSVNERSDLDIHSISADAGIRLRYPNLTITPRFFTRNMRLDRVKFYQTEGFELRIDSTHQLAQLPEVPPLDVWASFSGQDEDYYDSRDFPALSLRTGNKWITKVGLGLQATPKHYISLVGQMEVKSAARDNDNNNGAQTFSYRGYSAEAQHTWVLENRHFINSSLLIGTRTYGSPDTLVVGLTEQRRREQPIRGRVTYGLPLTDVLGEIWLDPGVNANAAIQRFANGATVALTGEYFYQRSNLINYQYRNARTQVMITRPFNF